MESQKQFKCCFSFEFFLFKIDQGWEKLQIVCNKLVEVNLDFFLVIFGVGGFIWDCIIEIVFNLYKQGIFIVFYLFCVGGICQEIGELLDVYKENGINCIVVLWGDMFLGMGVVGELCYVNELVEFICDYSGDIFNLEVVVYLEFYFQVCNVEEDLKNFVCKVKVGVNSVIIQYFFNVDSYFYLIDCLEKMDVIILVVLGIMFIVNFFNLVWFFDMCGVEIFCWI